jgi:hypothetical protein
MTLDTQTQPVSKGMIWTGRIASTLVTLFLLMDAVMKLMKPDFVVKGTIQIGWPENTIVPLGIVLLVCTILYIIPRTAVLGAILLTGYLGGAVGVHVRAGQGPGTFLFPVIFGAFIWGGLVLRDRQLARVILMRC